MSYFIEPTAILRRRPVDTTEEGLYVLKAKRPENDDTSQCIPVVRLGGKFYAIKLDQELRLEGFHPEAMLLGPLK